MNHPRNLSRIAHHLDGCTMTQSERAELEETLKGAGRWLECGPALLEALRKARPYMPMVGHSEGEIMEVDQVDYAIAAAEEVKGL